SYNAEDGLYSTYLPRKSYPVPDVNSSEAERLWSIPKAQLSAWCIGGSLYMFVKLNKTTKHAFLLI
ncbi:MAG: hypothetical protein PWK00_01755, partial [Coxiella burnetii]|nr:hypothetical protein [Coxiella burnetii]